MRYKIYTKTEKAWDAMLSTIANAKSSILIEMYIFAEDTSDTHNFIEILAQKALSGVKVKTVIDSSGFEISDSSFKKLKNSGVELLFFKTPFRFTHRKIIIVDEHIAFIGGINIKRLYERWDDLLVKIEGKVVKHIIRSFTRAYKDCGGIDQFILKHDKDLPITKGKVWFLENFPPRNSFRLSKYYKNKIELAKEKIIIITPYLIPNRWLVKALKEASKRGVTIEIIIPKVADHPAIANIPNYFYMHKLHKHGINFFLTKEMNHSKLMLVDNREGILGSQNMDIMSFDLNVESGIFFTDPNLIQELSQVTDSWKKDSVLYHPKMRSTHLFDHFLDLVSFAFENIVKFFNKLTA